MRHFCRRLEVLDQFFNPLKLTDCSCHKQVLGVIIRFKLGLDGSSRRAVGVLEYIIERLGQVVGVALGQTIGAYLNLSGGGRGVQCGHQFRHFGQVFRLTGDH